MWTFPTWVMWVLWFFCVNKWYLFHTRVRSHVTGRESSEEEKVEGKALDNHQGFIFIPLQYDLYRLEKELVFVFLFKFISRVPQNPVRKSTWNSRWTKIEKSFQNFLDCLLFSGFLPSLVMTCFHPKLRLFYHMTAMNYKLYWFRHTHSKALKAKRNHYNKL